MLAKHNKRWHIKAAYCKEYICIPEHIWTCCDKDQTSNANEGKISLFYSCSGQPTCISVFIYTSNAETFEKNKTNKNHFKYWKSRNDLHVSQHTTYFLLCDTKRLVSEYFIMTCTECFFLSKTNIIKQLYFMTRITACPSVFHWDTV